MPEKKALIIDNKPEYMARTLSRRLSDYGFTSTIYKNVMSALPTFNQWPYQIIITNLDVDFGGDLSHYPALKRAAKLNPLSDRYDMAEFAFFMIKSARGSKLNSKTPIIVACVSEASGDGVYPDAEKRSLDAGANHYLCTLETNWAENLEKLIEQYR